MAPLGAALLGTGIFAKDIYMNNFKCKESEVELKAIWSRTIESAQNYVQEFFPSSRAVAGEEALQQLLNDDSIQLVVVVLPVQAALKIVERCLAAGKAVIQEKPVAASVAEAAVAITNYRQAVAAAAARLERVPLWMFAENYRYEEVFTVASRRVSELGKIIKLDLIADLPMDDRNRYYGSTWRRDTSGCPGGFFMDSSVHFVAALRMLAGAAGLGQAVRVSAHAVQAKPDLSFPDSVVGLALFANGGVPASISISLAAHQVRWSLSVVGTEGSLEVSRGAWGGTRTGYTLAIKTSRPLEGPQQQQPSAQILSYAFSGCQDEFSEFLGLAIERQRLEGLMAPDASARSSPEEGGRDLALIEALLASAAAGGQPVQVVQM